MIQTLKNIAASKGYIIYKEPFKLNIWGIRSKASTPNKFDDILTVFFNQNLRGPLKWKVYRFKVTTDPGTYWLKNPMRPQGTAILAEGQYKNAYKIDLHRGKYYALCQRLGKVSIIRDYNRNAVLDFHQKKTVSGMFGINIHRARKTGSTFEVDNHSAGCQVFQNANDFDFFMRLCERHRKAYGNKFSYTLTDNRERLKGTIKSGLKVGFILTGIWFAARLIYQQIN